MKGNQYLIPANTKKGELILGIFSRTDHTDIIIFIVGIGITLLALVFMSLFDSIDNVTSIIAILPAGIATVLVFPFPNYYNIRTAVGEVIRYYTNRQRYIWRGWCSKYEFKDK